jgi:glycosyltransferase involved in cell wall biosynthesis
VRILFVSDEFPWPPDTGYRIRVANAFEAVASVATVDLFVASDRRQPDDRRVPAHVSINRLCAIDRPILRRTARSTLSWLRSGQPRAVAWRPWREILPVFEDFARAQSYDAVWYSQTEVFVALAGGAAVAGTRVIVDTVDLPSFKGRHRLGSRAVGDLAELAAERLDLGRWRTYEDLAVETSDAVLVCSPLDRERLGSGNVVVVPNGYDRPDGSSDLRPPRAMKDGPPTAVLVGLQEYPPNADAARRLADEIWPAVRERIDGAQLRIVGRGGEDLGVGGPGVTVTGAVPDIGAELGGAHVTVMPIRYGGGTRIKVLEAFASAVPVVATTVAIEGIDAAADEHLLVADDTSGLVAACVRVMEDDALRHRLAEAAQTLWAERYQWAPIRASIADVVTAVVGDH